MRYVVALQSQPDRACAFRDMVYHALWVNGEDISQPATLDRLWTQSQLDPFPGLNAEAISTMEQWQREWETGDFHERIPAMINSAGVQLLGFPSISRLVSFITGREGPGEAELSCQAASTQRVLVLTENSELGEKICDSIEGTCSAAIASVDTMDIPLVANVVVIDTDTTGELAHVITRIRTAAQPTPPAIVVVSSDVTAQAEEQAFSLGAADFIRSPISRVATRARLTRQLQNKRIVEQLERQTKQDAVTSLQNRVAFERELRACWRRASESQRPLCLLTVDIDRFRGFSEQFGHGEGDECLRTVGHALAGISRGEGRAVYRTAGDSFAIVLGETSAAHAHSLAERLRSSIEKLMLPHPSADTVTVSIGGHVVVPKDKAPASQLVHTSGLALDRAKQQGGNCVVLLND